MNAIVIAGTRRAPESYIFPTGDDWRLTSTVISKHRGSWTSLWGRRAAHSTSLPSNVFTHVSSCDVTSLAGEGLEGIRDPRTLLLPLVTPDPGGDDDSIAVWPRFALFDDLNETMLPGAEWQKGKGHWRAPLLSLVRHGALRPGFVLESENIAIDALSRLRGPAVSEEWRAAAERVGSLLTPESDPEAYARIRSLTGGLPDWFGMDLYGYQRTGCEAVAAGHTLLADEPGLGKTTQALAVAAIRGSRRVLVATPSIAATHWKSEVLKTRIIHHILGADTDAEASQRIVTYVAGRKEQPLPEQGVVIVTSSLIRARPELRKKIERWSPDVFIFDEAHVAKSFSSAIGAALRSVARSSAMSIALTGTPVFNNPSEVAALMAITGHLDTVFGGIGDFLDTYTVKSQSYAGRYPRKRALPQLEELLRRHVMVRRTKQEALPQLPNKLRSAMWVEADLVDYRLAYSGLLDKLAYKLIAIREKKKDGRLTSGDVDEFAKTAGIGMVSPLREAAGLAKLPAARDAVVRWGQYQMSAHPEGGFNDPLIVWVHHRSVMDGVCSALKDAGIPFMSVPGGTSPARIGVIRDEFQAGQYAVLVCAIAAAGVGITLTRATNMLFVETDWTNALMAQAESRAHRIGQESQVHIRTMVAPGTLDIALQSVLLTKTGLLDVLTPGSDVNVSVLTRDEVARYSDMGVPASTTDVVLYVARLAWARIDPESASAVLPDWLSNVRV